jgi:type I restriction enzyme S subunit
MNRGGLAELNIPLPPLAEQRHFVALVAQHECLRANQREALRQADHLFHSLLHRAFTSGL